MEFQGRVMYDLLLYDFNGSENDRNIMLECDRTVVDQIVQDMKKYKLRKEVNVATVRLNAEK